MSPPRVSLATKLIFKCGCFSLCEILSPVFVGHVLTITAVDIVNNQVENIKTLKWPPPVAIMIKYFSGLNILFTDRNWIMLG